MSLLSYHNSSVNIGGALLEASKSVSDIIEEISDTDLDASNRAPPILTEELW
jgi:hypothetical protein